ncbi:MAG: DUF3987 domain-containing protein [Parabacteroides sp.]|nr:DUF3987 domain-containing protein [Parabacteroides sp.]
MNTQIQERQTALDWLHQIHSPKNRKSPSALNVPYVSQDGVPLTPEDFALVEQIKASRSHLKFNALYNDGDLSHFNNDHSSADMALACILAFWCRNDPSQMDRIFRSSGLMRGKWDAMRGEETYGAMTIRKAVESTTEVYQGQRQDSGLEDYERGHIPFPPSPVPVDAFPSPIVALLKEAAEAFTMPLQIAVSCLLGMLSCLVGGARHISIRSSWLEPGNIWLATVAKSGVGKSPCEREFLRPIKELELKAFREWKEKQTVYEDTLYHYNKRKKDDSIQKPVAPKRRQAYVDDCTPEALGGALEDNPKGIMSRPDELATLIASMGQYNAKGNKDGFRSRLLSSYDGDEWKTNRATDPSKNKHIPHAYVSIFGGIQPGMMPKVFEAGANGADEVSGFLQRFMFIPAEREKPSYWTEISMSTESRALLELITNRLWRWEVVLDEYGRQIKNVVRVTDAAKAAFIQWFNALAEEEFFSKNPSLLSKLKGQAQRLVLLLHCLDAALNGTDGMDLITESTMLRGLKLAEWIKENQTRCWSLFSPGHQIKQVPPLDLAIMQVVIENADEIAKNGGRIANSTLVPQVQRQLNMPTLHNGTIGKAASALGLPSYSDGGRGRKVTEEKINEFRATVGSVATVSGLTESTEDTAGRTVSAPSATVGAEASPRQFLTVPDSRNTLSLPPEILTALGCSTLRTVTTVPPAVLENFEAAMHSFNTRHNVLPYTM